MGDLASHVAAESWRKKLEAAGFKVSFVLWPELATAPTLPPVLLNAMPERRYV